MKYSIIANKSFESRALQRGDQLDDGVGEEDMIRIALLLCMTFMLNSCVISKPPDNVDFDRVDKIAQLEGTYKNQGEGGKGTSTVYLSRLIWPDSGIVNHKEVLTIEVKATSDTTLSVKAHSSNGILHQSIFVEGKNFELHSGRIRLKHKIAVAGFIAGEPMVGPYFEYTELGIDQRGSGKYRMQGAVAGLVYLFLPLAVGFNEEVRFEKVNP